MGGSFYQQAMIGQPALWDISSSSPENTLTFATGSCFANALPQHL
jgi:hypothetical protein